jgi:hypothetical protein
MVFVVAPVGGILEGYFRVATPEAVRAAFEVEEPILGKGFVDVADWEAVGEHRVISGS